MKEEKFYGILNVDPFGRELFNGKYFYDTNGSQIKKEEKTA